MFLDTVAFARRSWQQRNRIATPNGPIWLTVPVLRRADEPISEVAINNDEPWRRKHWTSIEMNYGRAPFWSEYRPAMAPFYERDWTRLSELNVTLVRGAVRAGRDRGQVRARVGDRPARGRQGGSARGHLPRASAPHLPVGAGLARLPRRQHAFADAGIDLRFQAYEHPVYPQPGPDFTSHLSFLDALTQRRSDAAAVVRDGRGRATRSPRRARRCRPTRVDRRLPPAPIG